MSETIDPITWLRDSTAANRQIVLNQNTNELEQENSQVRVPKDAPTAWKSKDGKGYYSVGSLWMYLRMRDAKTSDYLRETGKANIKPVDHHDKRDVIDFFTGLKNESDQIDTARRAQTLVKKGGEEQHHVEDAGQPRKREEKAERKSNDKTVKSVAHSKELSVADYIAMNEKQISGRAAVIRCRKKNFLKVLQLGYQLVQRFEDADKIGERIEQRGSIAKDVNLDVQIFVPQQKMNLLDTILSGGKSRPTNEFGATYRPVIIVPAMLVPGGLSLANVKSFLEDGVYEECPSNAMSLQAAGPFVSITRRIANKQVTFDIYDSVTNFTDTRWQRIVAVFVNGQDWQFREWKNREQKRELFARVRGFYTHYANTTLPPLINSWNIKRLELQRNKRHHDINIRNNFWTDLEEFLRREKFQGCLF